MAELHDALTNLAPVQWSDVPQDNLSQYLNDCFAAGELICNSVPPNPQGTPFETAKPHNSEPNSAKSHKEMHPSGARAPIPHKDHEDLQRHWGKPVKVNQKENPLQISVYKMAGHDRHGAWFARRSVHEGLGFDKFKRAMMREFPHSLTVTGGPGAGATRGLAADRRLERKEVEDLGKLEVYELSAQFPGPVTPRDFITMLLSSDDVLTDKSNANAEDAQKRTPRHMMLVSRPVEHPDAPQRAGFVRGQYESVELIREIPLSTVKAASTTALVSSSNDASQPKERGHTVGSAESQGKDAKSEHLDAPSKEGDAQGQLQHDPELNPVEWIMVTRSDPGGGIPRFLVDRGTPEALLGDVHKFLNWACGQESIPLPDDDLDKQENISEQTAEAQDQENGAPSDSTAQSNATAQKSTSSDAPNPTAADQPSGGILQNVTNALGAGIDAYAPASISQMFHERLQSSQAEQDLSDDSSDTSSVRSFMSATELHKVETAPEYQAGDQADNLSIASGVSNMSGQSKDMSRHEKEMHKLSQKRERLDQQLAKKRMAEETKLRQAQEKDEAEAAKQKEKIQRDLQKMEEKHRHEVERLERKREKEAQKAEEKRKKKDDQNKLSLVSRERDDFRSQVDLFRRENQLLREQIETLQSQNNVMATRLAKLGVGEALKGVQDGLSRSRTSSMKSRESMDSIARTLEQKGLATP